MRERKRGRVHGPYRERGGWRVIAITHEGARTSSLCESEKEATRLAEDLRAELDSKDIEVADAIVAYLEFKQRDDAKPIRPASAKTLAFRLAAIFIDHRDKMVGDLTPAGCQQAYDELRAKPRQANDTHRNTLAAAKAFLSWCAKRGYASRNPMADVSGIGERSVGKEQLRTDEARALLDAAVAAAKGGDLGSLAVVTVLLLAIRTSECAAICSRDVDDNGRILVIPRSKTKAGVRRLEMPQWLGRLLRGSADANGGLAFVNGKGQPADRHWVLYHVGRVCRMAGVPEVTAHGLRGTHATLATVAGASSAVVAASLGHTHERITQRHYTRADATDAARSRRAIGALEPRSRKK